ncbi:MAG TPA: hypothetical protein VM639_24550 [Dongiaceae bacterium]|nr:hypothetical protein [Dongiaceae bacterium]
MKETSAIADVIAERQRQISVEGWTPEHDDEHAHGEMARAAACYALGYMMEKPRPNNPMERQTFKPSMLWPWGRRWWKPKDRRRDLVRAAALIIAEIERLDRAAKPLIEEVKRLQEENARLQEYAEVDKIMQMSEDELRADLVANGEDPDKVVADTRKIVDTALEITELRRQLAEKEAEIERLTGRLGARLSRQDRIPQYGGGDTYTMPFGLPWVCFHCGEAFFDQDKARLHFGELPTSKTICCGEPKP